MWFEMPEEYSSTPEAERLRQDLNDAELAFDRAAGEPKPVELSEEVLRTIKRQFSASDSRELIDQLSKTLGYLRRQGVQDERIAKYVLILAGGDKTKVIHYAAVARMDFRNIIYWVESPPSP